MNRVNIFHAVYFLLIYCSVQKMLNVMLASNCNDKIAAGLYQRKSLPRVFHALDTGASCTHQRFNCTKSSHLQRLIDLLISLSDLGIFRSQTVCLLSVLSQLILNGFTCNRSLIENEFLSQIHSLIVDRVNWVSSSYSCKVCACLCNL